MSDPVKPKLGLYRRHLLVCTGPRCTQAGESQALFESLGEKFKAAGIHQGENRVKRTRTSCFATCQSGPILCVQPDGIWYYNVTPENLDRIIREHLVGGEPVEALIYHRGPGCNPTRGECSEPLGGGMPADAPAGPAQA